MTKEPYKFQSPIADEMKSYLELVKEADMVTESYYYTFKRIDEYMVKHEHLEKSLPEKLQYDWLQTLETSSRSRTGEAGRLRQFSKYLRTLNIPASEVESVRVSSDYIAYNFTDDEIAKIIEAADNYKAHINVYVTKQYFPLVLRILVGCGMRISEVLELRWTDVNLQTGVITLKNAKNKKQRFVPMHSSLTGLMKAYQKRIPRFEKESFVFENPLDFDEPYFYKTFTYWFNQILKKANIPHLKKTYRADGKTVHSLRHYFTFTSFQRSLQQGREFEDTAPFLSAYLGHSSFLSTTDYITDDYMMYTVSHEKMDKGIGQLFPEVSFK